MSPSFSLCRSPTPCLLKALERLYKLLWPPHKSKRLFSLSLLSVACVSLFLKKRVNAVALKLAFLLLASRQCVPCTLDEVLGPPTTPEARNDEKALLEQLVSFLSGTDESELAELDKALGIDKLVQVSSRASQRLFYYWTVPIQINLMQTHIF